jgi:6-phosphofructokinase 2
VASLVTVTLNPSIDISTSIDRILPNSKLRCTAPRRDPGDGGINVARVVKRLGGDVRAIYAAGGASGEQLRRLLDDEGISGLPIEIAGETRENFAVFETATGQQYRFILPGPEMAPAEVRRVVELVASLDGAPDYIVASGSLPPGAPDGLYAELADVAKRRGSRFVIDASGPALGHALDAGVYLVKPSLRELGELVGRPLASEAEWRAAAMQLVETGKAELVALTLGEGGGLLITRAGSFRATAPRVKVASVVGAGDSFLAAMLTALGEQQPLLEAFCLGIAAGAATVQMPGTELCREDDVMRFRQQVHAERV